MIILFLLQNGKSHYSCRHGKIVPIYYDLFHNKIATKKPPKREDGLEGVSVLNDGAKLCLDEYYNDL